LIKDDAHVDAQTNNCVAAGAPEHNDDGGDESHSSKEATHSPPSKAAVTLFKQTVKTTMTEIKNGRGTTESATPEHYMLCTATAYCQHIPRNKDRERNAIAETYLNDAANLATAWKASLGSVYAHVCDLAAQVARAMAPAGPLDEADSLLSHLRRVLDTPAVASKLSPNKMNAAETSSAKKSRKSRASDKRFADESVKAVQKLYRQMFESKMALSDLNHYQATLGYDAALCLPYATGWTERTYSSLERKSTWVRNCPNVMSLIARPC
jgi:hypothetical protein